MSEHGTYDGEVVNFWEMDENRKRYGTYDGSDLVLNSSSLGGANGTVFAPSAIGKPTLQECSTISGGAWSSLVVAPQLKAGTSYCVRTSEGRHGKLTVSKLSMCEQYLEDEDDRERFTGDICVLEVSFVVWK
ncbi:hypothetical protein [Micromonospora endolithica]|uniref:hypothetical protein n=1 Tax=Micromonospora endolithica TaxID=230091 RepID=UPI0011BF1D5C|nr:hypothetical protein [Micromonospora endolithica]